MITKHLHSHQKACHSASCAAPRCFIYPKRFGASNHSFSKRRPYLLLLYSTITPSYHHTIFPPLMIPPAISMFISGVKTLGKGIHPLPFFPFTDCDGLGRRGHENPAGKHLRAILLRLLWPRMKRLRYPRPRLYRAVHARPRLPIQYSRIQIRVSEYRSAGLTPLIRGEGFKIGFFWGRL